MLGIRDSGSESGVRVLGFGFTHQVLDVDIRAVLEECVEDLFMEELAREN